MIRLEQENREQGVLSGSGLKLLALVCMTIDHAGLLLFGDAVPMRIIGRLAFPIFAFMIAEGCRYTRKKTRYFGTVAGLGLLCQTVYFLADHSLYMNILLTFSLSIPLVLLVRRMREEENGWLWGSALAAGIAAAWFLCSVLPRLLIGTDYQIDYGFWGVMLPVWFSLTDRRWPRLALGAVGMVVLAWSLQWLQWWCLLALLPLALYDGTRGKYPMKWLFYLYYPLHLVALEGIALLIQ